MFEKLKKIFKNRDEKEKHNYDLTFDNVAIPEVHVKSTESHEDTDKENAPILPCLLSLFCLLNRYYLSLKRIYL